MRRTKPMSAGLLAFRRRNGLEVLLAHPGGPFWAKKDDGVWTIPKGLVEPGGDILGTAQREFAEETGLAPQLARHGDWIGDLIALAPVYQKSGKIVHAFAFEADFDLTQFASNEFEIEWPPRSGRRRRFPEIDRIGYFAMPAAMVKIVAYQRPFLEELQKRFAAP